MTKIQPRACALITYHSLIRAEILERTMRSEEISWPLRPYAVLLNTAKWPNGYVITVRHLDGRAFFHRKVEQYAPEWSQYANIQFRFTNDPNADVQVSYGENGWFWSVFGKQALSYGAGVPTSNLGWAREDLGEARYRSDILHEFGHVLGLVHEHQHPQANIPWDKPAVYQYYKDNFDWSRSLVDENIFSIYPDAVATHSNFDPKSIMMYPVPNELTVGDFEIPENFVLSDMDKQFIGQAYPRPTAPSGYVIKSRMSGKVLDVRDLSTDNGARIQQWDYLGGGNQQWYITDLGGYYKITSVRSGKVLDVTNYSMENGTYIQQWDYLGGGNQQWYITDVGGGYSKIASVRSGKVLDVTNYSMENGTYIQQWDYLSGGNQQWQLIPL